MATRSAMGEPSAATASMPLYFRNCLATFWSADLASGAYMLVKIFLPAFGAAVPTIQFLSILIQSQFGTYKFVKHRKFHNSNGGLAFSLSTS